MARPARTRESIARADEVRRAARRTETARRRSSALAQSAHGIATGVRELRAALHALSGSSASRDELLEAVRRNRIRIGEDMDSLERHLRSRPRASPRFAETREDVDTLLATVDELLGQDDAETQALLAHRALDLIERRAPEANGQFRAPQQMRTFVLAPEGGPPPTAVLPMGVYSPAPPVTERDAR